MSLVFERDIDVPYGRIRERRERRRVSPEVVVLGRRWALTMLGRAATSAEKDALAEAIRLARKPCAVCCRYATSYCSRCLAAICGSSCIGAHAERRCVPATGMGGGGGPARALSSQGTPVQASRTRRDLKRPSSDS